MPLLSRALQAAFRKDEVVQKLRQLYITRPSRPKISHDRLSGRELDQAVSTFRHFDANNDKILTRKEFDAFIKWNSNYGIGNERISDVFSSVDADANNKISLEEFLDYGALKHRPLPSSRALEDMFYKCDSNEDGMLSLEELRHVLLLLGEDLTQYESLRAGFARYDDDKDGLINIYEFMKFIQNETLRARSKVKF